ncbi:MAG: CoA ester lyase [Chloroflexota bacterium]
METKTIRPRRSLIFFPGNKPELFDKACATGADMVTADLEDAIAPNDKTEARKATFKRFSEAIDTTQECIVRVNSIRSADGLADLQLLLETETPPKALMLPKVKSPDEVRVYEDLLIGSHGHIRFHAIIETNEGLEACYEIARASDRIDSILFGGVDMAADLRIEMTWEGLVYGRSRVAHAGATAGIDVVDVPYLDFRNLDGMREEAEAVKRLGFTGKASVHPSQIAPLNEIFSPSAEQIEQAKRIIAAFEEQGTGLVVIDNKLIEKPVLRSMYRLLAIAERMGNG